MTKAKKLAKVTGNVLLCVVVGVAVLLLVLSAFAGPGKALPGGVRPMTVLSGSMEPKMPVGSVAVAKRVDASSLKAGDIITFYGVAPAGSGTGLMVTHRIERVVTDGSAISFVTKGDANDAPDRTPVLASQVLGRVFLIVPYAGHVTHFVRTPLGLILMILLPAAILLFLEARNLVKGRGNRLRGGGTAGLVLVLCVASTALAGGSTGTAAYFHSHSTASATFNTGTWEDPGTTDLELSPGCSKAVRPSNVPPGPASFPIASEDASGKLTLDFGEVNPGGSNNSPDVFRIKNLGAQDVEVDVVPGGGFEAFVGRIVLGNQPLPSTLSPGQEESVGIKVDVPQDAAPGDYTGTIRVTATDGSFSVDIPALVTVSAKPEPKVDLALSGGTSKAVRHDRCPPCFPIASQGADGTLALDFGEVRPGNSNNSPDVFRIQNLGTQAVRVDVVARGAFGDFVSRIRVGNKVPSALLKPGDQTSVSIKLNVPRRTAPGDYSGIIRVTATDGSFSVDIPAIVTVLGKSGKSWLGPTQPDPVPVDPGAEDPREVGPGTDPIVSLPALSPGDSRAQRPSGPDGQTTSFTIASLQTGSLELDFGEVGLGDGTKSENVFAIKNGGLQDLHLDIEAKGGIKRFVDRIRLGGDPLPAALVAGSEAPVAIDIEIPADAAPGDYSGTIRVAAADGSFSVDIPVTVTIATEPDETAPVAEDPTVPAVDPGSKDVASPAPDQSAEGPGDATVTSPTQDDPDQGDTDTSGGGAEPPDSDSGSNGDDTSPSDPPSSASGSSAGDSNPPEAAASG